MLVIVSMFLITGSVYGQEPADSTKLKIDTISPLKALPIERTKATDSSRYEKQKKRIESSKDFYDEIKTTAGKNFFSKQLYPLLFRKPSVIRPDNHIDAPSNIPFVNYKGDVIFSIRIIKADIFGSSVFDTTVKSDLWIDKTLNNIHFKTNERVIRGYLLIKEGDRIDPLKLSDNERLIRQSSLFEDARFILANVAGSDSVDLIVIVKDIFPLGFDAKVINAKKSSVRLFNRNILGFGHQIEQSFQFNSNEKPAFFLSEGAYKARNILRSFTDARVIWQTRPDIRQLGLEVTRPFLTPEMHFGGGINIHKTLTWLYPDIRISSLRLVYSVFDFWAGYSTIIDRYKSPSPLRSQAAITWRYYNINYIESPSLLVSSELPTISVNRYIAGFSLIKSGYFKSNMIFGYGKTEDIPSGHLIEVIAGYETSILAKKYYTGFRLKSGKQLSNAGYIYSSAQLAGFWNKKQFTDGIAELELNYISRLKKAGGLRLRNYGTVVYTTGLNRQSQERIPLDNPYGRHNYRNYNIEGEQRLSFHGETVFFTPIYLLGFRFAAYTSAEIAMIGPAGKSIFHQFVYPAIGCGIRIKNENLVFSTFQFGLSWYMRPDSKGRNLLFEIKDLPDVDVSMFRINAPEFAGFR